MSKRFIDPDWRALRKLSDDLQRAWFYIWDKSDAAGVYHYDKDYLKLDLGLKELITIDDLGMLPECEIISGERILIKNFLLVNYMQLRRNYNPHKPAFRAIAKNNLFINRSLNEASTKLEEEGIDEGKDEEEEFGKSENLLFQNPPEPEEIKTDSKSLLHQMNDQFKAENPKYYFDKKTDFPALLEIAKKIKKLDLIDGEFNEKWTMEAVKKRWGELIPHIAADSHLAKYSISMINKHFQSVIQSYFNVGTNSKIPGEKSSRGEALRAASNKLS